MTEPKVEVVISGIGGLFPECNHLDELKNMLFDKKNGVTSDSRRWIPGLLGTPCGVGKIKTPGKFDNVFFGIHRKMAESLDALTRLGLERSVEAIVDAGINPADLSGTNTAVFMNSCISESEFFEVFDTHQKGFGLLGHNRAMQANRLSYTLNLNGPSYTTDATWIGGAQGLMRAKKMIEDGVINAAIIGSCSLCLNPNISLQLEGLGRLTNTNETRSFSDDANGMNRSEACVVVLLQKSSEAKRSYGTLMGATGIFGETDDLFYHYSDHLYKEVLLNAYKEANIDPAKVAYIEGEGLGIKKIDAMELKVLGEVFCTPNRIESLKVGSIKSNVGHCEATSSLVSLAKALIVLDSGYIPPNINYLEPNQDCPALLSGKVEVVTEKTPLKGDIVGISSFGLCNSFSHVILKQNKKSRTKIYEKGEMFEDGLPRIIFVSGRNEEGVIQFLERIKNSQIDEEFVALLQSVFYKSMNAHYYRSFTIVPDKNEGSQEEISYLPAIIKRPIWFVFSGMGSQWNGMGKQLLNIPIFAESVSKCEAILKPKGVDLIDILTNDDPKLFDNILNSFVGIAAIQIGLLDVLKSIDVVPDGIIGHSVGELGCAYADGCFTAEQMILAAHARGRASIETELIDGSMAAIGLGYNDIKDRLPHDIEVACHNASDSSTLSGPTASVSSFVEQLKSEGVFAKLVNVSNIAYHSQYIRPAAPTLLKYLKEVIPEPKPRSSKWVSSSVPESEWGNEVAKYSSPEYHTNNLLGQVLFEEASRHIPEDAIVIEIAPHGLLQAILKRSLPEKVTNIPLTHRSTKDSVKFLLSAFGKMYNNGMTPNIEAFYPSINYPVSRQTQALHSIFPWDHTEEWALKSMMQTTSRVSGERQFTIHLNNEHILFDYKINGRHIIPNSILLSHVWKSFIIIQSELYFDEMIAFEELNFRRNIEIAENDTFEFYSLIQCGSGYFEICLENEVIVSGKILRPDATDMNPIKPKMKYPDTVSDLPHSSISKHDLYSLLEHNGYELGEQFKTVTNIDLHFEEYRGNIKWDGDWMRFLNGIFTLLIHKSMETNDNPADVSTIRKMYIDPSKFKDSLGKDVPIYYNFNTNEINGDGIYILHPETKSFSISTLNPFELRLEEEQFLQLADPNCENEINFTNNCLQVIFECKKFQSNPNMNNFKVYHSYNDNNLNQSITLVKQILDIQIGIQHTVVSLDKTNPEKFINNDHNIILLPYDQMTNVISVLKNTKRVHLLVTSKKPMSSTKEWNVIMQQQFNGHYLVLIKKIREIKIMSIKLEYITDIQHFYEIVKNSLAKCKKTKHYLYIFTKVVPYVNLTRFMEKVLLANKSNKIRFVFLLDNSGPDFNIDHKFYTEQLRKQLFVNVYKDGKWGTIVRNLVDNSSFNVSTNNKIKTYISDLTLDGLNVKYFGINFKDLFVNNNLIDSEFGHLEYSGIAADGKKVMGIAPFGNNTSNQISPDPHLTWIIPSDQTLEDAATIPMSYSMAYYILTILKLPTDNIFEKTILVNDGFNAVGQAAIAVAISLGYSVYITVENKEQCKLLKNKFPSVPESRIFNYHDNFEVQLKIATKGKGTAIIVNCFQGPDFYGAVRSIADRGKFFQLSKTVMKNKDKLGLVIFIKNVTFYSVSPDRLLAETSEIKLKVQNEVQKGIDLGVVKPFDRHVLTGPCSREQAIQSLYLSSQGVESNRVVLALEGKKTLGKFLKGSDFEKYQCYSNRVYLIVGSKYSTWIDIAEWIVMRGARKIVVALKKYSMSTTASRRFNLLISRYQNVVIQIVSDSNLNSKEDLILLLNDTTSIYPLGGIFFATLSDEEDKIRNIQYVLESNPSLRNMKPIFVCIMSGGENTCTELRANGVCPNTICLSWSLMATEPNFSNLVPSLDKLLLNVDKISSSTIICNEYDKKLIASREFYSKMIAELPASIDELNEFGDTVTEEIDFVEVSTNSLRFADSIGLPVFVVTGFMPKRMKKMYENLMYPAFEARLPETIESIEHVARILVQKLKSITKCGNVSLIGISWGGAVCVLIAQLLEADNIAVSLTLLEGIPNVLEEWTKSLLQYGSINAKLLLNYFQISSTMTREIATKNGWNTELPKVLSSNDVLTTDKTLKALNAIRSRLSALFELKPLPNRILAKVRVIYRNINVEKSKTYKLEEYCVHLPEIISFDEKDYEKMISGKKLSQYINNNILHYHPDANEIPITELYKRAEMNSVGFVLN